jgi:hypothetical protein
LNHEEIAFFFDSCVSVSLIRTRYDADEESAVIVHTWRLSVCEAYQPLLGAGDAQCTAISTLMKGSRADCTIPHSLMTRFLASCNPQHLYLTPSDKITETGIQEA